MAMITGDTEFIKNRSFEIAWAVFRCSNIIKQPKLKTELENASVGLVSQLFGQSEQVEHLERLEQLVRLAEAVGEISKTNALVLFREIDNLKEIVRQRNSAIRQEKGDSSAIEKIFAKPPMVLFSENPDNSAILRQGLRLSSVERPQGKQNSLQVVRQDSPQVVRQENSAKNNSSATLRPFEMPQGKQAQDKLGRSSADGSPQIVRQVPFEKAQDKQSGQDLVLKKVKELGKTTTKEILGFFPEISERTVRFYLQGLCEQGLVSRVGTTGPGSYYVVR